MRSLLVRRSCLQKGATGRRPLRAKTLTLLCQSLHLLFQSDPVNLVLAEDRMRSRATYGLPPISIIAMGTLVRCFNVFPFSTRVMALRSISSRPENYSRGTVRPEFSGCERRRVAVMAEVECETRTYGGKLASAFDATFRFFRSHGDASL